jgi:glycerate dehydrogenase
MRAVFLDLDTLSPADLDLANLNSVADWSFHGVTAPAETAARLKGAAIAVSNKVLLDRAVIEACPDLKLIVVSATGVNNVDLDAARERGIRVCNVRNYGTPSVAQHVFSLILALTIKLPEYLQAVREGRWQTHAHYCLCAFPIRELFGKRLGVIGHGTLGKGVAAVGRGFGMDVVIAERRGAPSRNDRLDFDKVLTSADVLTLHCPLTPETKNLIGAPELKAMKRDAILINCARGGLVDEAALISALRNGVIAGAAFDVLTEEPPARGNPLLEPGIPNLIVTPHIAWAARESRQRMVDIVAEDIRAWRAGTPQNVVA